MSSRAKGTFDVKMTPQPPLDAEDGITFVRMAGDKQFQGDMTGTSHVEMLAARTGVDGSAGYVAMERLKLTLGGKSGGFALQHSGTMKRGDATLVCTVVPDSGWGGLAGIDGKLQIDIVDKQHYYTFDYTLAG